MKQKMEDIEILCRHLSENLDIHIEFVEDACPATDGKKIVLPSNMNKKVLLEMLATLIHETAHIKYTNMEDFGSTRAVIRYIVNVLEDIRVDKKVTDKYSKANELFWISYQYTTEKYKDRLIKEEAFFQILKHLLLIAKGYKEMYYNSEAIKTIEELKLMEDVNVVYYKENTRDLFTIAENIAKKLKDYFNSKQNPQNQEEMLKKAIEAEEKATKKLEDIRQKQNNNWSKQREKYRQQDSKKKGLRLIKSNVRKKDRLLNRAEQLKQEGLSTLGTETEKKAKTSKEKSEQKTTKYLAEINKLQGESLKLKQEGELLSNELENTRKQIRELQETSNNIANKELEAFVGSEKSDISLQGFSAIGQEDIFRKASVFDKIILEKSLDEKLKDFFVGQIEERQKEDEGRIARNKLYKICCGSDDIYTEYQNQDNNTNIIFLLDSSDSMGYERQLGLSSGDILISTLNTLLTSLERICQDNNLPINYGVYSFDERVKVLKKLEEKLDTKILTKKYQPTGGTNLLNAVNLCERILQNLGDNSEKILLVLTDGEVSSSELKELNNQTMDEIKTTYIGINIEYKIGGAKQLFKYNITNLDEILDVLTAVITRR